MTTNKKRKKAYRFTFFFPSSLGFSGHRISRAGLRRPNPGVCRHHSQSRPCSDHCLVVPSDVFCPELPHSLTAMGDDLGLWEIFIYPCPFFLCRSGPMTESVITDEVSSKDMMGFFCLQTFEMIRFFFALMLLSPPGVFWTFYLGGVGGWCFVVIYPRCPAGFSLFNAVFEDHDFVFVKKPVTLFFLSHPFLVPRRCASWLVCLLFTSFSFSLQQAPVLYVPSILPFPLHLFLYLLQNNEANQTWPENKWTLV